MKHITKIILFALLVFSAVACQKEDLEPNNGTQIPEGKVRIDLDMSALDFGSKTLTRSGEGTTIIATEREIRRKNSHVYIFDARGGVEGYLLQYVPVISDYDAEGKPTYYAVADETDYPVTAYGLANVVDEILVKSKAGVLPDNGIATDATLKYADLHSLEFRHPYSPTDTKSPLLRKVNTTDGGISPRLPIVLGRPVTVTALNQENLDKVAEGNPLQSRFTYARIDVWVSDPNVAELLSLKALNVPNYPYSTSGTEYQQTFWDESHVVTKDGNESAYPFDESSAADKKRYIQGMYVYSTNTLTADNAMYLVIKAQVSNGAPGTYYKLLLRHSPVGEGDKTSYNYNVESGTRYLVKINSLETDGYATEAEAIAMPPANIDYDIIIDENTNDFVTNGQYYIGAEKNDYTIDVEYDSHLIYTKAGSPILSNYSNLDVTFNIGSNVTNNIDITKLNGELLIPDGVTVDNSATAVSAGFNTHNTGNDTDWDKSFGSKKLRLRVPHRIDQQMYIKIGDLSYPINLTKNAIQTVTDYSNYEFVNELTGLRKGEVMLDKSPTALRLANCYILKPEATQQTVFYIPVGERINEFWTNSNFTSGGSSTNAYDDLNTADWTNSSKYSVEMAWYYHFDGSSTDPETTHKMKIERAFSPSDKNAIKVTLPANFPLMSTLVVVKNQSGQVIWSWHLWITDYNPYRTNSHSNGKFTRNVRTTGTDQRFQLQNGEAHSYNFNEWNVHFTNRDIMDRHLGSHLKGDSPNADNFKSNLCYYQYGRKDPLVPTGTGVVYKNGFSYKTANGGVNFVAAVQYPTTFYKANSNHNNNWTSVEPSNGDWLWNDHRNKLTSGNYYIRTVTSIFDPSPLGWNIDHSAIWVNTVKYSTVNDDWNTYNGGTGNKIAYIPRKTILGYNTGAFSDASDPSYGGAWTTESMTTSSTGHAYSMSLNANHSENENSRRTSTARSYGLFVRSVSIPAE